MSLKTFKKIIILISVITLSIPIFSHCQIPCGIYNDKARVEQISEHISTIEKSMKEITKLSGSEGKDFNQIVRWITNKDKHADKINEIISYYFLAQRIKPTDSEKDYFLKLKSLHLLMIYSMKSKQKIDLKIIKDMRNTLRDFSNLYFKPHKH